MSKSNFTELELKAAVVAYAESWRASEPMYDPNHVFSTRYEEQKQKILALGKKHEQRSRFTALKRAAAVIIIIAAIFGTVMLLSPSAYAAFRNWTINIYNKFIDFTFIHSEDDHAVIIAAPGELPDGFELAENYHSGYYTRSIYKDSENENFLQFEYRKPTEAQKKNIEKRGEKAEQVTFSNGVKAFYSASASRSTFFWYDKDRNLSFSVISNLDKETLLDCFASVSYRLPYYEPAWLPDGYKEEARFNYYPGCFINYYNGSTDTFIYYNYKDMAEYNGVTAFYIDSDIKKYELINTELRSYYYITAVNPESISTLIWLDEENKLAFCIDAFLTKEEFVKLAENIRCVEPTW